jgi:hypothetical protein
MKSHVFLDEQRNGGGGDKWRGEGCGSAVHIALLLGVSIVSMAHLNKKFVQIFSIKIATCY